MNFNYNFMNHIAPAGERLDHSLEFSWDVGSHGSPSPSPPSSSDLHHSTRGDAQRFEDDELVESLLRALILTSSEN